MDISKNKAGENMTYIEYVCNWIAQQSIGKPIYLHDITEDMAEYFVLEKKGAAVAVSVAVKRIMDGKIIKELRLYRKGIYYLTEKTAFGEFPIDKDRLILDRYLANGNGYETGITFLYRLGLTTQIPINRFLATNRVTTNRADNSLNVTLCSPKTVIDNDNKDYLQVLDALEILDKAPIDSDESPYLLLARHIKKNDLSYEKLLALANNYYNKNTILKLAKTASEDVA